MDNDANNLSLLERINALKTIHDSLNRSREDIYSIQNEIGSIIRHITGYRISWHNDTQVTQVTRVQPDTRGRPHGYIDGSSRVVGVPFPVARVQIGLPSGEVFNSWELNDGSYTLSDSGSTLSYSDTQRLGASVIHVREGQRYPAHPNLTGSILPNWENFERAYLQRPASDALSQSEPFDDTIPVRSAQIGRSPQTLTEDALRGREVMEYFGQSHPITARPDEGQTFSS
jgi:hypothetical protein